MKKADLFEQIAGEGDPESDGWKAYWESDEGKALKKQFDA